MRALLAIGLVLLAACGVDDRVALPPTTSAGIPPESPSPVAAGERDPLPVHSTTTTIPAPPRASRGGERSSGAQRKTPTPPTSVVADPGRNPGSANPGGSPTAKASWYDRGCCTASGERFNPNELTFAARSRQWGRRIRFCHEGRCVVARQNDYGPAEWTGRTFDLSRAAFEAIGRLKDGEITVTWEVQ